jgi:hypothetical protein
VFARRVKHPSPVFSGKTARRTIALAGTIAVCLVSLSCNEERQRACNALVLAMKPIEAPEGGEKVIPPREAVAAVEKQVESLKLEDQPLRIYAENYLKTLAVLSNTMDLKSSSSPPDGTDDVIKKNLKEARTQADDVKRYCAQ